MKKKAKAKGPSRFWTGLLVGGAVAGAAVYFWPALTRLVQEDGTTAAKSVPKAGSLAKATSAPPPSDAAKAKTKVRPPGGGVAPAGGAAPAGGIAFFRRPDAAAGLPGRFGMQESYPGSLAWKKTDALGWNSFGILPLPKATGLTGGGSENSISCLLESTTREAVEVLRLSANVANPRGEADTISRFKTVCLGFLNEARCPVTKQFIDAIGGMEGMKTESPEGYFELERVSVAGGYRLELTIRSK